MNLRNVDTGTIRQRIAFMLRQTQIGKPLQLDYTPEGDRCIYCGKDSETCEHNERDLDWSQYADKESDAERNQ